MIKLHFFRKFLVPSVLNVIGLAVAFASSFVIATQVVYDYTYDRGIEDHDKIFRMEVTGALFDECSPIICKPASDIIGHQPHVLSYSAAEWSWTDQLSIEIESQGGYERIQNIGFVMGFGDFLSTFSPRMISGNAADLALPNHVLLPLSIANRVFGSADCVGRQFFREDHESDPEPKIVAGVFADFPSNCSIPNAVMIDVPSDELEGYESWGRFNNSLYVKVDDPAAIDEVINSALREILKACPEQENIWGKEGALSARPLTDTHFSDLPSDTGASASRSTIWLLLSLAIAIIIVAAINFTNFSLAETPLRIAGINTRKVLGDSILHLRWRLLVECVVTCVVAFAIGMVALACADSWLTDGLVNGDPMSNHGIMALWLAIAVVTGVVAGVYPSYYVTSFPPALVLKGSFGLSPRGKALRTVLLCLQFATAFAFVVSIGLMRDQMEFINNSYRGFDRDVVITAELNNEVQKRQVELRSELMGIAGVEDLSYCQSPLGSDGMQIWTLGKDDDAMRLNVNLVDSHYLHTMGIKIVEGRDFNETDKRGFIMNETAKRKFPKLEVGKPVVEGKNVNVIGFCKDFQFRSLHNDDADEAVGLYLYNPEHLYYITLNIRVAKGADRVATIDAIRKKLDEFSPGYDFQVKYYDEFEQQVYEREIRFDNQVSVFSVIAIVLSIMGVLGLTLFECASRQKEIGIRRVLGCTTGQIVWMFCRHYAVLLAISFAVGAPVGYLIVHNWLMGFAIRTAVSPSAFILSAVIVTAITMLTVAFTSLKSTRTNPKDLLRSA